MKRKLVKQGAATMMISLPSKWIKENHLDKGSEVDLVEENNNLVIKISESEDKKKKSSVKVDVSNYSPLINRILISLYVKGFDEVELIFKDEKEIKELKKHVVEDLLGFEIIKQRKNLVLIKDITSYGDQNIEELVDRIFFILDSMVEELVDALEKKQNLSHILEIDRSVNKFAHYCLRLLNKGYSTGKIRLVELYGIISLLEQIGDIYKQIITDIQNQKGKIEKYQLEILQDTKKSLSIFKEILFSFDKEKAVLFAKSYVSIKNKIKIKKSLDAELFQLNETIIRMNNYLLVGSF